MKQAQLFFQEGLRCLQMGNVDNADLLFAKAYSLDPKNIDVLNLLGIREYQKQNYQEAICFLTTAHHLHGNSAQTLNNLGLAHNALKEFQKGLEYFDLAVAIDPGLAEAHNNRGNSLKGLHQNDRALEAYQYAIQIRPEYAEAISNRGIIFLERKNYQSAIQSFEAAIQLNPNLAVAFNSIGNAYTEINEYEEAFKAFNRALQINPQYLDARLNFGSSLKKAKQYADAIKCFEHAALLNPSNANTYFLLGEVFYDTGDWRAADASFRKSLELDPENTETQFALAITQIPKVPNNIEELHHSRMTFSKELESLRSLKTDQEKSESIIRNIGRHPFYLAYQEEQNLSLLNQYGDICVNSAKTIQDYLDVSTIPTVTDNKKIRIGIVSHYFYDHPVWHAITKGWVNHLNPDLFEIHIINTDGLEDEETKLARQKVASYTRVDESIIGIAELILSKKLDAILFPEVGMDIVTKALACLRLAPIQMASWGHPETTGLSTIDYFISAESLEPEVSAINYREKLITLPKLGTYFESEAIGATELNLQKFNIDTSQPILLCAGSPSKYSPLDDYVLIEIAQGLGDCQFIFFNFQEELTTILKDRLYRAFNKVNLKPEKFLKFIPFLRRNEFYGLMMQADLYLDTMGFSGFNTAVHAINCNLPVITKEGLFMRGRLASAILRNLDAGEFISATNEKYIESAIDLINNKKNIASYKEKISSHKKSLFNDLHSIKALEKFLIQKIELVA